MNAAVVTQSALLSAGSFTLAAAVLAPWWPRTRAWARVALITALGLLSAGMAVRWAITGHPPIFGTYENSLSAAWFVAAACLALDHDRFAQHVPKGLSEALGLWALPLLATGLFAERTPYPLTISERSLFVDVHVLFAWSAQTVLLAATTAAVVTLSRRSGSDQHLWDDVMVRGAGFGFALFTVMLALGSTYSYLLFSDWFRWEVVEAFAAAAWLAYATILHAVMMFGWRDRKLAVALLVASVLMLGTFWVWAFWTNTYHHFDIPAIKAE